MLYLITGGSGSGKSEFAESLVCKHGGDKVYLATMHPYDEESRRRVERHRKLRQGKGFRTVEREHNLEGLFKENRLKDCAVLLEDLSNLLANEMYMESGRIQARDDMAYVQAEETILQEILRLEEQNFLVVVVTNEVFSGGGQYDEETTCFLHLLAHLNRRLAMSAEGVAEVVCGIALWHKGGEK